MKEDSRRRCRNAAILHKNSAGALLAAVKLMLKNNFLNVTWLQEEAEVNNGSSRR